MSTPPGSTLPEHEGLRRAVEWLVAQPARDAATIEAAAQRFDLSPVDTEFLMRHFRSGATDDPE